MAETTGIEWTDSTFNPWIGCTRISPACDHCYAEALMDHRHHRVKWGGERSRTSASNWQQPRRWQKQARAFHAEHGRRRRVFCASLADVFDNQVPEQWRADLWALIADCPDLDWLLLTKRPQNIADMLPALPIWDEIKGSIWLGTTVEDQKRADQNIVHLLQHDSAVRFLSCEPMVGVIDLVELQAPSRSWRDLIGSEFYSAVRPNMHHKDLFAGKVDWVIAGGESGPQARVADPDWFRILRDQCAHAGVPFLFKQWGEWADAGPIISASGPLFHQLDNGTWMQRYGKKANGRLLDGIEHNGFPEVHNA